MPGFRTLVFIVAVVVVFPGLAMSSSAKRAHHDIVYGENEKQRYDAYLPARSAANGAAVVFLHGGAWRFGDKGGRGSWTGKTRHLNAQGVAFFSVNTRLLPDAGPFEQAQDLAAALGHIQRNAASYGIAADRIVLMGHSAGAHVAALLSADRRIGGRAVLRGWAGTVLLDTAVLDTVAFMSANPSWLHRNAFGADVDFWEMTSPMARLTPTAPPFLIVCSTARRGVCDSARGFAALAGDLGVAVKVLPVALSHRQINTGLGSRVGLTRDVDSFLRRHLQY